jgi:hypothetical protein
MKKSSKIRGGESRRDLEGLENLESFEGLENLESPENLEGLEISEDLENGSKREKSAMLVDSLPKTFHKIKALGKTKELGWEKAVDMAFHFDFTGCTLEKVFNLAASTLIVRSRPALKKLGYQYCLTNPNVYVSVKEYGTRSEAPLSVRIAQGMSDGTIEDELRKLNPEQLKTQLALIEKIIEKQTK